MPVSAPSDRRFRRTQLPPRRRAPRPVWWRRLLVPLVVAVLAWLAVYGAAVAAVSSQWMTVTTIAVSGNDRVSTGEVHALLEGLFGSNLLTADLDSWSRKLRASPWVADVSMRRQFPGTIAVALAEHRAVAIGRISGLLYLIDSAGVPIEEFGPHYAELDLPIVDGLAVGAGARFLVDAERAALAARLFEALRPHDTLARRISQVDVRNRESIDVLLKGDTVVLRIGNERFAERLQSYLELASRLREHVPEIDYVDLRHDGQVVVKPLPRGGRERG